MRRSIQKHLERSDETEETGAAPAKRPISPPSFPSASARGVGLSLRILRGVLQFPHTFVVMNSAAIVGLYAFLRRRKNIWVRSGEAEAWEMAEGSALSVPVASPSDSRRKAA